MNIFELWRGILTDSSSAPEMLFLTLVFYWVVYRLSMKIFPNFSKQKRIIGSLAISFVIGPFVAAAFLFILLIVIGTTFGTGA